MNDLKYMCQLDETAHFLCGLALSIVQPRLTDLNLYFESDRDLGGIEKWFQVELAFSLLNAGYCVEVEKKHNGKKVDIVIAKPGASDKHFLELKAGIFFEEKRIKDDIVKDCCKWVSQKDVLYIGCLFLCRSKFKEPQIRSTLESESCTLTRLEHIGDGKKGTKWWLGVARKTPT